MKNIKTKYHKMKCQNILEKCRLFELLRKALQLAYEAHKKQKRKSGEPFINHPLAVGDYFTKNSVCAMKCRVVGYLHDVLEDTVVTEKDLQKKGFDQDIIDAVKSVTRKKNETYFDFIMRVRYNAIGRKVKLADLEHNMSDLDEGSLKDKYRFAHRFLAVSAEKY